MGYVHACTCSPDVYDIPFLPVELSRGFRPTVAPQILQYQHKMEEMQVEFAQMLRETLDRMHERLANGTFNKS